MVETIKELKKKIDPNQKVDFWHDDIYHKFMRSISVYLTRLLLYTPISANQITILSIIIGVIGAYILSFGKYWYFVIGTLMFQLMYLFDCSDGEIARYKNQSSLKGLFLDSIGNRIVEPLIFIFLSFGVYKIIPDTRIFLLGAFAASSLLIREILIMIGPYLYFETKVKGGKFEVRTLNKNKIGKKGMLFYIKKIYDAFGFIFAFPAIQNMLLISAIFNAIYYAFIFYGITLPIVILISLFYESNYCFQRVADRIKKK